VSSKGKNKKFFISEWGDFGDLVISLVLLAYLSV
jgi:hypothetical protein|tara:strand:- start:559 stop:660 length:102 start_codon:yes stop_codon:yes gene_type:complete